MKYSFFYIIIIISLFSVSIKNKLLIIKEISSLREFFIILDNGIYIYDYNLTKCLKSSVFKNNINSNNIALSEFQKDNQNYIICLIIKNLYLYNSSNRDINFLYLKNLPTDDYNSYDLKLCDIQDNYFYIIVSLIEKKTLSSTKYINFLYYKLNFITQTMEKNKENIFEDKQKISEIKPSCHIISFSPITLRCYYCRDFQQILSFIEFKKDAFNNKLSYDIKNINVDKYITKISSTFSNEKIYFICILGIDSIFHCFIHDDNNKVQYSFSNEEKCQDLETYYFNETSEFVIVSRNIYNNFNIIRIQYNNTDNNIIINTYKKNVIINECGSINKYLLIYNESVYDYNLITDCNFTETLECSANNEVINNEIITEIVSDELSTSVREEEDELNSSISKEKEDERYISKNSENIEKEIINKSKEELIDNLDDIITKIDIDKKYEIKGKDFILRISPTNESLYPNSTHVNFGECEKVLRNFYNISNTSILTLLQLELENDNLNSLINQIEYEIYDNEQQKLNLTLCKDSNIQIYYAIKENTYLDISTISYFKNLGFDIFNINDSFFNDLCTPYSNSKNDIILRDRIKDIYQNYSLCEENCEYNTINIENKTITCDCKVKDNLTTEISSFDLEETKKGSFTDSNIAVIKCYKLVFSFDGKLKNYGFLIFSFFIIINIVVLIL